MEKQWELLREVREIYNTDRALYKKIKALPIKSRTACNIKEGIGSKTTIAFIASSRKTDYYKVTQEKIESIDFLDAAFILRAPKEEPAADFNSVAKTHFDHVKRAMEKFEADTIVMQDSDSISQELKSKDRSTAQAQTFLRNYITITGDSEIKQQCRVLLTYVQDGIYSQLSKTLRTISQKFKSDKRLIRESGYYIDQHIEELYKKYYTVQADFDDQGSTDPNIVISETFI